MDDRTKDSSSLKPAWALLSSVPSSSASAPGFLGGRVVTGTWKSNSLSSGRGK